MVDLDEYREKSLQNWDAFSGNWADEQNFLHEATGRVARALVDGVDPQPGQTILELAAGTGDVGFAVAERLGDDGKLIQTDFAPGMVEQERRLAADAGLTNIEHRVMDAEKMDLDDDSVDGVVVRYGYMLMADPAAALSETKRVLRDGGKLSFAVWTMPDRNLWAFIPAFALVEAGHLDPPDPEAPGIFALGDPERVKSMVAAAGFADPEIQEVTVDWDYTDPAVHWEKTMKLAAPIADAVNGLPDDERERIKGVVAERVAEKVAEDATAMHGHSWVVTTS
jgi:ubiquinone/menaquinone biosynthesis C-methylase UbiE